MVSIVFNRRTRGIIFSIVIIIVGIIHLGVGIGICAKYSKFHNIFEQQVGLSAYNILIGLLTIPIGIAGLLAVLEENSFLSKIITIAAFILGIMAFISLVTALALSGQAATYLRDTITDDINDYVSDQDAIDVVDKLQSTYQCCGVNLWLDWARVSLGVTTGVVVGRRRREESSPPPESHLIKAVRRRRQTITSGTNIYNLPASYTINLPLSCCQNGGVAVGNSLGGYCVYNAYNSSTSFYVSGCLEPVSNIAFSQITGIAVINTCLTILAFIYATKMIKLFRHDPEENDEQPKGNEVYQGQQQQPQQYSYGQYYGYNKQPNENGLNEGQQQLPYLPYYMSNNNSNQPYSTYADPSYKIYL